MSPNENVIISNSFEEIVFSERNKEYGAYVLRKRQKRYLLIAFSISLFVVASSAITPLIFNQYRPQGPDISVNGQYVHQIDTTFKVDVPLPPEIKVEPAMRFVPPTVVDSVDVTDLPDFTPMDDLVAVAGPTEVPTTIVPVVEDKQIVEVEEKPFIVVEEPAKFQGGDLNDFNRWVAEHIKYPQVAVENGITGKVNVQFVVNAKGEVENVIVLRGADPSLDEEALRVIKSSPRWKAPKQGGRPVKQLFSLPVIFKLSQ
jgi:protein TonB